MMLGRPYGGKDPRCRVMVVRLETANATLPGPDARDCIAVTWNTMKTQTRNYVPVYIYFNFGKSEIGLIGYL